MPISWNEIRHNAIRFAKDWAGAESERAEKQTFWNEFFQVFGIPRRTVASFEEPVRGISGKYKYIDLFWRGMLLVEHKSQGEDLGKAKSQAFNYIQDLVSEGRHEDVPRYVILSDFQRITLYDLEPDDPRSLPLFGDFRVATYEFSLPELHKAIHSFAFIPGYKQHKFADQDPINLKAVGIMGRLHDTLAAGGYKGHALERFLVRILFCLFSEDTGIFNRDYFGLYIENRTKEDGSDLGVQLAHLFEVLNTPEDKRQKGLDETLAEFPYVNGELFAENLRFADLNRDMRNALLACTRFDWSRISPAIFGSLFQAIMKKEARRQIGGHYTSERDILKVIRALFLDDLREEFERAKRNKAELRRFHQKLAKLRFLDPACGCGNFLVISYREMRLLEIEVLKLIRGKDDTPLEHLTQLDVDAYYGIEILEWPARISEVAMWLMDHQMNQRLSEAFGQLYRRLPLRKSPHIVCGNALRLDWKEVLPPEKCSYVLGNPPFVGKHLMTADQASDMCLVWDKIKGAGVLDYVTAWYCKAAIYIQGTRIPVAFVSTNSISQGEQPGALWNHLFQRFGLKIHFAHRTFNWTSEARGKAHVHVVIIGFGAFEADNKLLYDYGSEDGAVTVSSARNISPYLVEGPDVAITARSSPICNVPPCEYGNKPTDGGHLIIEEKDRLKFLDENPEARKYLRPLICAEEYLYSIPRWCLWLAGAPPSDIRDIQGIKQRVDAVRDFRLKSKKEPTKEKANTPTLFAEIRQPISRYVVIPRHTSETRKYVPFGYFGPNVIVHDSCSAIPKATLYHFGVLSSLMHMAWMRQVCGRLESRYRYSGSLVYNNFPWPGEAKATQKSAVETAAQDVLDARKEHPNETLAVLYDPPSMPPNLVHAHTKLDRSVDRCYRPQPFTNERQRVEYLFWLYENATTPLVARERKRR